MKWKTTTNYVDLETGEQLRKEHIENKIFTKVECDTKYIKHEYYNERKNTWKCRKIPTIQLGIGF